jgi:hypothetical protein
MILVDSSVYVDWIRDRIEPQRMLEPWIRNGVVWTCGVVRLEVVRGIRHPDQKARTEEFFDLLSDVPCDGALWKQATDLAWRLDREGKVLPVSDLVIAACALAVNARVLTTDEHFHHIPELQCLSDIDDL